MPVNLTPELGRAGWPADLDERARTAPWPKGGRKPVVATEACPARLTRIPATRRSRQFYESIKGLDGTPCSIGGRELETLILVADGKRNEVIAAAMGITYATAKIYVHRLNVKLGCENRIELMGLWVRHLEATSHA